MRILILGGPKTGKTTLSLIIARRVGFDERRVQHTDDLCGVLPWGEDSEEVAKWIVAPSPWIIEGVAAVRALRKAIAAAPDVKPATEILYLQGPWVPLTKGQAAMTKGHETVWAGIVDQVMAMGCAVTIGRAPNL